MTVSIDEKLALDKYNLDEGSHISVDQKVCETCANKFCLTVCPARAYTIGEGGRIAVDHAGCLECGTCIAACELGGLTWNMPASGMGVAYRYA